MQKNLHLRKDALKQLGMPPLPLDTDDKLDDDIEDEYPPDTDDIGNSSDDGLF